MSNATDKVNAPKRMETGKTIRKKYRDADMETMGNMLMQLVYGMDADTDQDFLGELYMACNLGNDHAGQFFTPYNVCPVYERNHIRCSRPAGRQRFYRGQ